MAERRHTDEELRELINKSTAEQGTTPHMGDATLLVRVARALREALVDADRSKRKKTD